MLTPPATLSYKTLTLPGTPTLITTFKPLSVIWTSATSATLFVLAFYTDGAATSGIYKFVINTGTLVDVNGVVDATKGVGAGSIAAFTNTLIGGYNMLIADDGACYVIDSAQSTTVYKVNAGCSVIAPGGVIGDYTVKAYNLVTGVTAVYSVKTDNKNGARLNYKQGEGAVSTTSATLTIADQTGTITHKHASDLVRNVIVWGEKTVAWITVNWADGTIVANTYTVAATTTDADIIASTYGSVSGNRAFLIKSDTLLILENRKLDKIQLMTKLTLAAGSVATALAGAG